MNAAQTLWWKQAQSDFRVYQYLKRGGIEECHRLHYLQMATEKLSKAYFWRAGSAPPKTHTGFVRFLRALATRQDPDLQRISVILGFSRAADFVSWARVVMPLAYRLQNLAPAEAGDGPNPEYPWPHDAPTTTPAEHTFTISNEIFGQGHGRRMLDFVQGAIEHFDEFA